MASKEQLLNALRQADSAGNFDDAQRIAAMIRGGQFDDDASPASTDSDIQPQDPSFIDNALGAVETAGVMASGAIAEPIAGLAGLGAAIVPGGQAGYEAVESARERLMMAPESAASKRQIESIGEFAEPVTSAFESAEAGLGNAVLEATASSELAAIAHTLPTATLEALGLGMYMRGGKAVKSAGKGVQSAAKTVEGVIDDIPQLPPFTKGGKAKARVRELIEAGESDIETARYSIPSDSGKKGIFGKLAEKARIGADDVINDPLAGEAIKQGFDEGVIAPVKMASDADKAILSKMADTMEKVKKNRRFGARNRPTDEVGKVLESRVNAIQSANKKAGKDLDGVAKSLKGQRVDVTPATDQFIADLDDIGVIVDAMPDGTVSIDFIGSSLDGLDGPQKAITRAVDRMIGRDGGDAYNAHLMKKWIDESVTYGKQGEGLKGKTSGILKNLRRNIDGVLDSNFPAYDKVNSDYAETISALDKIQDLAGRKADLSGANASKELGQMARGILSNNKSRTRLLDSVDMIEGVAAKYAPDLPDNDLLTMVIFADELDRMFGSSATTSFKGQIEQVVNRAPDIGTSSGRGNLVVESIGKAAEKARGINDENAFKAIRELLKGNR